MNNPTSNIQVSNPISNPTNQLIQDPRSKVQIRPRLIFLIQAYYKE